MKEFPYQTIQQFKEGKEKSTTSEKIKLSDLGAILLLVVAGMSLGSLITIGACRPALETYDRLEREKALTKPAGFALSLADMRAKPDSTIWKKWAPSAMKAVSTWQKEDIKVPSFTLVAADAGACQEKTPVIACTYEGESKIVLIGDAGAWGETPVMLHEIAHLLGIPDIPDDPLMGNDGNSPGPIKLSGTIVELAKAKQSKSSQYQ